MSVAWPALLQSVVNEESFSFIIGETSIRSDMEVGPAKVRRRFTKSVDGLTCSINLTQSEFQTFYDFYDIDLNGGTKVFSFIHPVTQVLSDFRFTKAPNMRSLGGGNFRVVMEWEQMP